MAAVTQSKATRGRKDKAVNLEKIRFLECCLNVFNNLISNPPKPLLVAQLTQNQAWIRLRSGPCKALVWQVSKAEQEVTSKKGTASARALPQDNSHIANNWKSLSGIYLGGIVLQPLGSDRFFRHQGRA